MSLLPQQPRIGLKPADPALVAGVSGMVGRKPAAPAPAPAGGIGVRQSTTDQAGHPAPGVATDLPAFSAGLGVPLPPVPAPRVPAPAAARVGESTADHPDNPVQAPAKTPGNYGQALTRLDSTLANRPLPARRTVEVAPNYSIGVQGGQLPPPGSQAYGGYTQESPEMSRFNAEAQTQRTGLYQEHHQGWSPGEYQAMARQGPVPDRYAPLVGAAGPPAPGQKQYGSPGEVPPPAMPGIGIQATHPNGTPNATGDQFRDRLTEQMNNPGFTREGGIAVYRGNAGDNGDGPSIADRNALTAVTAQNQLAAYDMKAANIRKIDGEIHNQNPHTAVAAAIGGLATPEGRALAEGQNRMEPGSIPVPSNDNGPGAVRYNATNAGPGDRIDPNVQGLHNILHGDMPLHQKVAAAASIPGMGQAGSPHQQLFDAWMARQQATDAKWAQDVNQYGNTGQSANHPLSDHGWLGGLFGDPKAHQAGPTQARNQKFHADMAKLGYRFHAQ